MVHQAWWTILLILFAAVQAFFAGYEVARRSGKWKLNAFLAVLMLVLAADHVIQAGGHL